MSAFWCLFVLENWSRRSASSIEHQIEASRLIHRFLPKNIMFQMLFTWREKDLIRSRIDFYILKKNSLLNYLCIYCNYWLKFLKFDEFLILWNALKGKSLFWNLKNFNIEHYFWWLVDGEIVIILPSSSWFLYLVVTDLKILEQNLSFLFYFSTFQF